LNLGKIIEFAYQLFESSFKLKINLETLRGILFKSFSLRFEEQMKKRYPVDLIRAVTHVFWKDTWLGVRLLDFLLEKKETEDFVKIAKLGVRLKNILKGISKSELAEVVFNENYLEEAEEKELYLWLKYKSEEFKKSLLSGRLDSAYEMLMELADIVERFFQKVFVMVDDVALRMNRLKLLKELDSVIMEMFDASKIVI